MLVSLPLLLLSTVVYAQKMPPRNRYPQVISHRGACGYVPEHSLAAYRLAIDELTDYVEPDLCLSKDGVFVAMHDLLLDETTNVASLPQYVDRYTTKTVNGVNMTGYFVSDFLFSELQTLRLLQRIGGRSTFFNDLLLIPRSVKVMST
jgi:glycerophosphoryl diester phosphodiesterase